MLLNVKQVQKVLGIPESTAYKVIRELNQELKDKGFLTVRGKCEKQYLYERYRIDGGKEDIN